MSKYFKFLVLAIVAVGLMAGSAFGGTILTTSKTVAAELIPAAADCTPTTRAPISYRPDVDMGGLKTFTLKAVNGEFDASAANNRLVICSGTTPLAKTGTAGAEAATIVFTVQTGQALQYNTLYPIQQQTDAGADCIALGVYDAPKIDINGGVLGGNNVTVEVSAADVAGATASAVTAYSVQNQLSASLSSVTSKLSFADNMETFVASGTSVPYTKSTTESQAALTIVWTDLDNDIPNITDGAGCTDTLAVTESITAKITGNLTGISAIEYNDANPYTVLAADRTNGYATLTMTGTNLKMCKSTDTATAMALELTAANATGTAIVTGTRTALITLKTATDIKAADRALVADTASHIIQLDATILHVPFIRYKTDGSIDTAIVLQTNESSTGANGVQVVAIDATGVERTLTITGKTEVTEGTPLMILGSEIFSALETAGYTSPTLGDVKTTGVKVLINTTETKLRAYATVNSSTGDPRLVPIRIEGPSSTTTSILR